MDAREAQACRSEIHGIVERLSDDGLAMVLATARYFEFHHAPEPIELPDPPEFPSLWIYDPHDTL